MALLNTMPPEAIARCWMSGRGWAWPEWSSGWIVTRPDNTVWFEHDRVIDVDPRAMRLPLDLDLIEVRPRRLWEATQYSRFRFPALTRTTAIVVGNAVVHIVLLVRRRDAQQVLGALRSQGVLRPQIPPDD